MSSVPDDVRLRLDISYDGTDFSGWAVQPGRRTVAGVLTDALRTLLHQDPRLVVAGRTDAGVHATGQVAHLDVPVDRLVALTPRHLRAEARSGRHDAGDGTKSDRWQRSLGRRAAWNAHPRRGAIARSDH